MHAHPDTDHDLGSRFHLSLAIAAVALAQKPPRKMHMHGGGGPPAAPSVGQTRGRRIPAAVGHVPAGTDFAAAIETDLAILSSIGEVVWMGGTVNAGGNIDTGIAPGANPDAEWNAYWNPQSVLTVPQSGVKVSMFPLDITNSTLLAPPPHCNSTFCHRRRAAS